MKQASDMTAIEAYEHSPEKEGSIGGGWRIKERKTARPANTADLITSSIRKRFKIEVDKPARKAGPDQSSQRRPWYQGLRSVAGMGAAVAALITVAVVLPLWLNLYGVSQKANAEIQTPATAMAEQEKATQQITSNRKYQLHLGSYDSELEARLLWAGVEADLGVLSDGLDPLFKSDQGEHGTSYQVLAGKFPKENDAAMRCAWLRLRNVVCSVVSD